MLYAIFYGVIIFVLVSALWVEVVQERIKIIKGEIKNDNK